MRRSQFDLTSLKMSMGLNSEGLDRLWPAGVLRPTSTRHILLVSEDLVDHGELASAFRDRAIEVTGARCRVSAARVMQETTFDAVVLDGRVGTPAPLQACRQMVAMSAGPVVFIAQSDAEAERIAALDAGAEDSVDQSCGPRELAARVRAVARRARGQREPKATVIQAQDWCLDLRTQSVTSPNGATAVLSPKMLDLMMVLLDHAGETLSTDRLDEMLGGYAPGGSKDIDWRVRVHRLRAVLTSLDPSNSAIRSIRGRGYVFASWVQPMRDLAPRIPLREVAP